jgi:hypothetical protein
MENGMSAMNASSAACSREVLVHHADAVELCVFRVLDRDRGITHHHPAGVRVVETHDAFDERALAGAVLA